MIIMWLDDSNSFLLRLWRCFLGMFVVTSIDGLMLFERSHRRGSKDARPLTQRPEQSSSQCKQAATLGLLSCGRLDGAEDTDSTLPSFTSECVRRCLLKAVRKWVDGRT